MKNTEPLTASNQHKPLQTRSLFGFTLIYAVIVSADLLVLSIPEWREYREITKPLILGSLMACLLYLKFPVQQRRTRLFFLALLFSFLGDGFLNYEGYFLPGLFSFFIAHIFYIITFLNPKGIRHALKIKFLAPLLLYAFGVYYFIAPDLGGMKPYVILYMGILIFMVISVLSRKSFMDQKTYMFGLIGGVLFLISDSLLAVNKFSVSFYGASQLVMTTYALAQYFLFRSFLSEDKG